MSDGVFNTLVLCLYVVHDVQHWKTWNKFQQGKSFKENCASLFVFKSSVICNLFQCLENSSVLTKTTKQLTRCFLFSIFSLRASRPLHSSCIYSKLAEGLPAARSTGPQICGAEHLQNGNQGLSDCSCLVLTSLYSEVSHQQPLQ